MQGDLLTFPLKTGVLADLASDVFPSQVSAFAGDALAFEGDATHFVYVHRGNARLRVSSGEFALRAGMYGALPGAAVIDGRDGEGIVLTRLGERALFMIGGPAEDRGRLRYIDGCTDSLLIPPYLLGAACLNLLHIPPQTEQTQHTHPSLRAGLIASGTGHCVLPERRVALAPGLVFVIPAGSEHSFHTGDEALRVIAWHPDSDVGPTHEDHPMLNRTFIGARP